MSFDNVKNFSQGKLVSGIDDAVTEFTLESGQGALFPAATFNVLLFDESTYPKPQDDPNKEIVRVSNRADDVFTMARAQEGTSAHAHGAGARVALTVTAKTITDLQDAPGGQVLYDAIVAPSGGDYTTVQAAIDAGKKRIFIRAGTYTQTGDITIANDDTWLIGESWATVLNFGTNYQLKLNMHNKIRISNMEIRATSSVHGAIVDSATFDSSRIQISGCLLNTYYALELVNADSARIQVYDNVFTGMYGLKIIDSAAKDLLVSNNIFFQIGAMSVSGTLVGIKSTGLRTSIVNNEFFQLGNSNISSLTLIDVDGAQSLVENNNIEKLQSATDGTIIVIDIADRCRCVGNAMHQIGNIDNYGCNVTGIKTIAEGTGIENNSISYLGNTTNGVAVTGIDGVGAKAQINGNLVEEIHSKAVGGTSIGIYLHSGYNRCVGNTVTAITGAVQKGILTSADDANSIIGNYSSSSGECIFITALGTGNQVIGNTCVGGTPITDNGTNTLGQIAAEDPAFSTLNYLESV